MVLPFHIVTQSADQTQELGKKLGHSFLTEKGMPTTVCLWGDLGSGKTTFVQGFSKGLGIPNRLLSPTFIIVRRYAMTKRFKYLYHLDLYRIFQPDEVLALGFADMSGSENSLVVVEWPERLGDVLPDKRIDIRFTARDDGTHSIEGVLHG